MEIEIKDVGYGLEFYSDVKIATVTKRTEHVIINRSPIALADLSALLEQIEKVFNRKNDNLRPPRLNT